MQWKNLAKNKCPKCEADLIPNEENLKLIICKKGSCNFKISEQKMREIVADINSQEVDKRYQAEEIEKNNE